MRGAKAINDKLEVGDLAVLFLFTSITVTALLADDYSMSEMFRGICTIGLMHFHSSGLAPHADWLGRSIDGTAVICFGRDVFNRRRMTRLGMTGPGVMAAACQRGLMPLEDVWSAVTRRDDKIFIMSDQVA